MSLHSNRSVTKTEAGIREQCFSVTALTSCLFEGYDRLLDIGLENWLDALRVAYWPIILGSLNNDSEGHFNCWGPDQEASKEKDISKLPRYLSCDILTKTINVFCCCCLFPCLFVFALFENSG